MGSSVLCRGPHRHPYFMQMLCFDRITPVIWFHSSVAALWPSCNVRALAIGLHGRRI
jgi:hypothetical protein